MTINGDIPDLRAVVARQQLIIATLRDRLVELEVELVNARCEVLELRNSIPADEEVPP